MPRVLAWIYDAYMRKTEAACLRDWRAELLGTLTGDILEVGAGTGVNLRHYPAACRLTLAEPDPHMRAKLERAVAGAGRQVTLSDAGLESLPFATASFDAVVSTLVLCSVEDQARALGEIRRVLKPGGRLVFIEHIAAEGNPSRLAWQRRLEPLWMHLAGNCHLTRATAEAIGAAGFRIERERRESMRKALPILRPTVRGVAVRT